MKKILMTLTAVLCCAMTVTVGLTSCSQSDNPVDPKPEKRVTMADVVTLNTAPQSFYKLDTKELLPIYIAVNSAYKDEKGETQFYDLSTIKEVNVSVTNDMFIVDASHLADNGYIKLTPDPDNSDTKSLVEIVEDYGVYKISGGFTVELINKKGEKLVSKLDYIYLARNEQKEVLDIKLSDLNEKNQLILEPTVLKQYDFSEWPIDGIEDFVKCETEDFIDAEITEDGKLILTTNGATTAPDDPDKLTLVFTRNLTGSPIQQLPEGEGLMVNFRYELELNISE
jgi:hypothetical protein